MPWIIINSLLYGCHVAPNDDLKFHDMFHCSCGCYFDEEADATIHISFDGREDFERGLRKPS